MSDNKHIVLNLEHNEYDNIGLEDTSGNSILWQQEAAKQLVRNLIHTGEEAKHYKADFKETDQVIHFSHNAICIHGGRGTGKTVFLNSAKQIWEQHSKQVQTEKLPKLHFLSSIDPTMLHQHDSFASVIIAQLYNAVEKELSSQTCSEMRDQFYNALRDLANAHGKSSEFEDATGIDRILNYRSGIRLQDYFHKYVFLCTKILSCDGIVVSIDDVDMSLSRAFEVLDDVRRFLSCPLIIPIVSGDLALYNKITENHFKEQLQAPKNEAVTDFETEYSLTDSYLTKVFPNHLRINLLSIELLQVKLRVLDSSIEQKLGWPYRYYLSHLNGLFFPFCNGMEKSNSWKHPKNARELTQIVRAIPPKAIEAISKSRVPLPNENLTEKAATESQLRWIQNWAKEKKDGNTFLNIFTYFKAKEALSRHGNGVADLPLFSIAFQVEKSKKLGWGYKDLSKEQGVELEFLKLENETNKKLLGSALKEGELSIISMPPLEFFIPKLQIRESVVKESNHHELIRIYSHKGYYSRSNNSRPLVFFSRAFEILLCSILKITGNAQELDWDIFVHNVLSKAPFYSVTALNPSKITDFNSNDDEDEIADEIETNFNDPDELQRTKTKLKTDLENWESKYKTEYNLEQLSGYNFFPLFSYVFNKVFTQLHLYRINLNKPNNEGPDDSDLSDSVKRFEYIVINAFIFFLKRRGTVSDGNIAIKTKAKTIKNRDEFFRSSNPARINFSDFLGKDGKAVLHKHIDPPIYIALKKLVEAIWDHPIFTLNKIDSEDNIPLGTTRKAEDKLLDAFNSAEEILAFLDENIKRKGSRLSYDDVESWIDKRTKVAMRFNERLNKYISKTEQKKLLGDYSTNFGKIYNALKDNFES